MKTRGETLAKYPWWIWLMLIVASGLLGCTTARPPVEKPALWLPPKELSIVLGNGVTMEFVLIPSGRFMMGSDKPESDERPAHQVTINMPFYLGKYLITQEQWQTVVGNNPSRFKGARNPVEQVSWYDCNNFERKMRRKAPGHHFSLPSEAQWEYACRAGS